MKVLDLFKLDDKVALVTGGAKGLGTAINEGLLEAGVSKLFFCGRGRHGSMEDEQKRLSETHGAEVTGIQCDVTDESQVSSMVEEIKKQAGKIDILVNNAGVTWNAPSLEQTSKSWHRALDTNLTGTFFVTRDVARELMIPHDNGRVVNISSLLALIGVEVGSQVGYSASKSAILGLTRQLAVEWAGKGIRVNAIVPGFVEGRNSMSQVFTGEESPVRGTILDMIPIRRFANTDDLKAAVCYLASDASAYMTGQYLVLDGGMSIK
ncbi:MAG: SDR family NAD(P)-dependent oxidoreductase [Candidatus Odinarchaeota archaeon]